MIDLVAEVFDVPAGLIMKVNPKDIEVFAEVRTQETPMSLKPANDAGIGLYCGNHGAEAKELTVANALADPV